jgi:hypothetical protein
MNRVQHSGYQLLLLHRIGMMVLVLCQATLDAVSLYQFGERMRTFLLIQNNFVNSRFLYLTTND